MPTNGFSIKPLKVKLLAGEQNATAFLHFNARDNLKNPSMLFLFGKSERRADGGVLMGLDPLLFAKRRERKRASGLGRRGVPAWLVSKGIDFTTAHILSFSQGAKTQMEVSR